MNPSPAPPLSPKKKRNAAPKAKRPSRQKSGAPDKASSSSRSSSSGARSKQASSSSPDSSVAPTASSGNGSSPSAVPDNASPSSRPKKASSSLPPSLPPEPIDNPFELPEEVNTRALKLKLTELLANSPMAPVQFTKMSFSPLTQSWAIGLDLDHSEQQYRPPDALLNKRVLAVFISGTEEQVKLLLALSTLGNPVEYIHHVAPQAPASMVVTVKVMAECFNLSTRRIQQLTDEGVMVKVGRGSYNLIESLRRYVEHLRKEADGSGGAEMSKHQIKLAEEKATAAEMKRLLMEKRLGDIQAFEDRAFTMGRAIQSALDALPRLAPELAVMGDERAIRERLEKEKRGILDGLKDQCGEVAG